MKCSVLNQYLGTNAIGDALNNLLIEKGDKYHHLKILMAFFNDGGLKYIRKALEQFYKNKGIIECIIGIDEGVTTYTALSFLRNHFPEASLYLFHDNSTISVFHHKVIIIEGEKELAAIIGSANLTMGGLYSNYESVLLIEIDKIKEPDLMAEMLALWDAYRNPEPPMINANLKELTIEWLKENRSRLSKKAVKKSKKAKVFSGFGKGAFAIPKFPDLIDKNITIKKDRRKAKKAKQITNYNLCLQVLKETGAGGTQVQIPTEALSYFGVKPDRPKSIRIKVDNGPFRDAYITHFPDNTHRISIRELEGVHRPTILKFVRSKKHVNTFECSIIKKSKYKAELARCTEQTRDGARFWGIW